MITVTGATGQLGRLVVTGLLDAGVAPADVTAVVRSADRAADLAARGVTVRVADYGDRPSLDAALEGTDRLLLVSSSEVGHRVPQHAAVIEAAKAAGVALLVYTSVTRASTSTSVLAPEHAGTEELIAESGIPAVVLRNNSYLENQDQQITRAAATGSVLGSAAGGRMWPASRADFAAGAVAVLTATDPAPDVIELGGDEPFTLADLAGEVARQTGREVVHADVSTEEHIRALVDAGLEAPTAGFLAALDAATAAGAWDAGGKGISGLTGRPTTTLADHVRRVLAQA